MTTRVNLLFLLDPTEASNVDTSEKKLNQMLVMADKEWQVHTISSRTSLYENPVCEFRSHQVSLVSSPDSIFSRVIYDILIILKSVTIIKKHNIHALVCT